MINTVIKIDNLSKQYRLGDISTGTISHDLNKAWYKLRGKENPYLKIGEANDRSAKGFSDYVWSLKDISIEVNKGDAVGIIGKNGAGKSTLLKLLSKVTKPTTGTIKTRGRIASLLEVGTGFHPELSGRDNIFLNGAIMGMKRFEIANKLDAIVDFSGVERYIDTPVKRYSSGMYVRLAFAVAAYLESEILIVDEVLAVGDAEFQKKCLGKMGEVSKGDGRTILFVSHNLTAMQTLCNKGILLQNGSLAYEGNINNTITNYLKQYSNSNHDMHWNFNEAPGNELAKLLAASINAKHKYKDFFETTDELILNFIFFNLLNKEVKLDITFHLADEMGNLVFVGSSGFNNTDSKTYKKGEVTASCTIPNNLLQEGTYTISRLLLVQDRGTINFEIKDIIQFEILNKQEEGFGWIGTKEGIIKPKLEWEIK